uniref:Male reproductive-related protein B n=1 Tax=Macrobrachium rosenbergii TaxID=79674 RepID=B8LG38_MACRS|nr:male reproductive-related protein B [Macrobrachium rosenbergii]
MKDLPIFPLLLGLAFLTLCCHAGDSAGAFGGHTVHKRDAEQKAPPFGVMSTCICYPMSAGLPAGFPGKDASPSQLAEWANNQGRVSSSMEAVAESKATADVSAPTYVQVHKDDSVDTKTLE